MAYATGTVVGHYALLDAINTFVTATLPVAERWVVERNVNASGPNKEIIWRAPGLSGTEEIFMGLRSNESVSSDYYNLSCGVFTGFVSSNTFAGQPGAPTITGIPAWNQSITYWLQGDGQFLVGFLRVENVYYTSFYIGKYLAYATPWQYPYPVFKGGCSTGLTTRYSDTTNIISWFKGGNARGQLKDAAGAWINADIMPYYTSSATTNNSATTLRNTIADSQTADGYYGLHPIVLSQDYPNANIYGELYGVYYISGFNNAVENTLTVGGVPYIVFRDINRTGFKDYIAMRAS